MQGTLNDEQINYLLQSQAIGRLVCHAAAKGYAVPITYVYDGQYIYGQTKDGLKVQTLRQNPSVCFEVDTILNMDNWQSVIIQGVYEELIGEESQHAQHLIVDRITPPLVSETVVPSPGLDMHQISYPASLVTFRIRIQEKFGLYETDNIQAGNWSVLPKDRHVFTVRLLTGIGLVITITSLVFVGDYGFLVLLMLINGLGLWEFYRLFTTPSISPLKLPGFVSSTVLLISVFLALKNHSFGLLPLITIPLTFGVFLIQLYKPSSHPFQNIAFTLLAILCITFPLALFNGVAFFSTNQGLYDPTLVFAYFCLLWANDTGAFITGKLLGKYPLFKRISPKKTWEGSLGGIVCTLAAAYLTLPLVPKMDANYWLFIALIIVVSGTYGDLVKSMMKRSLSVKDAGTLLPGHGGILDRFDSLLGSTPFVYTYLQLIHSL
ncbi:phosphatidate cytidylyltransferase [Spirosoma aureum]|uniref:Phosphatidate cytidylyltransferase n=1 Tax=Spirosoma aureum TaxID=2692134 RepID=A0A6G9AMT3_9BACT|nr:phosphatidate cytidylyltransferase [Spirosoma aureum]QIP13728.1 phosphatidate cytidylyltransferase [Spirosoma aureum]